MIRGERVFEVEKQKFAVSTSFSMASSFAEIDLDGIGVVTLAELHTFLLENNLPATLSESKDLLELYISVREGALRYSDFARELSPRASLR